MSFDAVPPTASRLAPYRQIRIPLPDCARLSARLWLPAGGGPAAAVVEWIPYRSSDATAVGDSMMHGWFADHGLAALRIDIRGSGNSDGVLLDEYLEGEQDDAVAAIAWIARQDWCNGAVGLIGISWGGFAALQIAARRPPALKAVITACSTDDRYRDDVHFMGGCLLNDGVSWGAGLFTQIARPPDPAHAGADWRRMWHERLDGIAPPLARWLAHRERDDFWRHGSVCEDYSAIACPVFAVSGWTDGYSDAALRLAEHLRVPRRTLVGPWTHVYPHWGTPGPAIGFLQEALAWWRRWLVEGETPDPAEMRLDLWLGERLRADARRPSTGGEWLRLDARMPAGPLLTLHLGDRSLDAAASGTGGAVLVDCPQDCGLAAGEWCPLDGGGDGPEFQSDQRPDDGRSLCYDTAPLEKPVEILGAPAACLRLALDGPEGMLALRLNEVAPDGLSSRITFGLLRLRRPDGVAPGMPFDAVVTLKAVGYRFSPGHRLRLAVSNTYWPMAWPLAVPAPVRLWPGQSRLELPLRDPAAETAPARFCPAEWAPALPHQVTEPEMADRLVSHDLGRGLSVQTVPFRRPTIRLGELVLGGSGTEIYEIDPADPAEARTQVERCSWFRRPGWAVEIRTSTRLSFSDGALVLASVLAAFENDEPVFERAWNTSFEA